MRKLSYILIAIACTTLLLSSCKKSFLDDSPTSDISDQDFKKAAALDPSLVKGLVSGLYNLMIQDGTGGTTADIDFGQKGYDIFSDMLSGDMVLAGVNYGWYSNIAKYLSTTDYTRNSDYQVWRYYYRIGFNANRLIKVLGGDTVTTFDNSELQYDMGQAKAMRAYAYFYLTQFYSTDYGDGSKKILPVYPNTEVPNQPKSTTKDVFDFIVKDLNDAITLLDGFQRTDKSHIDQDVAKGLLAYILAYRAQGNDLQEVVTLTNKIMTDYSVTDSLEAVARFDANGNVTNPQSGFNDLATPSWMWGMNITLDQGLDLVSWWGQIDMFTYSYAWAGDPKVIDIGLYDEIPNNDIRKDQFVFDSTWDGQPPAYDDEFTGQPVNKFFAPKRVIGGQRSVTTDYVYMRADEFYLLNAETNARLKNYADARTSLKDLLKQRRNDYETYVDNIPDASLLDSIYLQEKIELWGEGKSYLAMKRLKKTITLGSNHLFFAGKSFAYDDPKLTFLIPQAEVLNNANLNK